MLSVRQATLSDIEDIVPLFDLYRQFYGQSSNPSEIKEFLLNRFNHGESVIFIAYSNNKAVGFTQLYPSFSSTSLKRIFILNDLFVLPELRTKGVGSSLLKEAKNYAQTLGAIRLTLSTAISNTTAQKLYESTGWIKDQEFFHYNLGNF